MFTVKGDKIEVQASVVESLNGEWYHAYYDDGGAFYKLSLLKKNFTNKDVNDCTAKELVEMAKTQCKKFM
jgi:hypothetical protein